MRSARRVLIGLLMATALVQVANAQQSARKKGAEEEFSAILTNISNVGRTGLTPVNIHITRWTGDEENMRLLEILRDEGQDAFLRAIDDVKSVGWIATPTSLRYDFYYARYTSTRNGGRRIILITDRPMQIWERLSGSLTQNYPFTVVQLDVDEHGEGEGTLAQLAQLRLVGDLLGIENLATGPMRLSQLKKVK